MALWLAALTGLVAPPSAFDATSWHAHEMVFGFAGAAVTGYALTLIPNWTGSFPLQGWRLAVLAGLWAAGRVTVTVSAVLGAGAAMVVDLSLPALVLAASAREVVTGRNWRNLPLLGALSLLLLGNGLMHLEALSIVATAGLGARIGLATLLCLIGLIGGRLLPSFTRNRLAHLGEPLLPRPFGPVDRLGLGFLLVALIAWSLAPDWIATAPLALAAGAATAWRQSRWRPHRVGREPILLAMHLGYAWLSLGLLLLGVSGLAGMAAGAALHAWGVGAVGTMILAVMCRTSLAHTARRAIGGAGTAVAVLALTVAAGLRLSADVVPEAYWALLLAAGLAWAAGFTAFLAIYTPILTRSRLRSGNDHTQDQAAHAPSEAIQKYRMHGRPSHGLDPGQGAPGCGMGCLDMNHIASIALLQNGFRPMFLLAGIWAPIAMAGWITMLSGLLVLPIALPPLAWHPHELLFGYAGAVIAGFLLTAVPNWTGRLPVRGYPLLGLVCLWLAARFASLGAGIVGAALAATLDVGFWVVLAGLTGREVLVRRNWHNLPIIALVALMGIACGLSQAEAFGAATGPLGRRLGLGAILVLIGLVGGRVVPSFTRNWLAKRKGAALPASFGRFDLVAMAMLLVAVAVWVVRPDDTLTAALMAVAGAGALARLARLLGWATSAKPLVLILHLGYGWLGCGLLLVGAGGLFPTGIGQLATLHALTTGAIGTMTLAIMTRATLGHTGRALTADRATCWIYGLVQAGAVLRVAAPVLPLDYRQGLLAAGLLWAAAFVLFVLHYGPLLLGRQQMAGPG